MNPKKLKLYANYIPKGSYGAIISYKTKAGAKKALERVTKWDHALLVNGRDNKGRFNGTWVVIYYNVMNPKRLKLYNHYIPEGSFGAITLYKTKAGAKKALERDKKWDCGLIVNGRDNKGRFDGTWAVIYYNMLCLSSKV